MEPEAQAAAGTVRDVGYRFVGKILSSVKYMYMYVCVVVDKENKVPKSTRTGRGTRGTVAPPRPQHHIQFFVSMLLRLEV